MTSQFEFLDVSDAGSGILVVRLDRAPVNAVHQPMYIEICSLFKEPDVIQPDVRAIVLVGAGRMFCAGNDLDEFATMLPANGDERMWRVREAFNAISQCCVPVVAVLHGAALGTGLALAASCDFAVAESECLIGLPELCVGVMGGARHLARWVPQPVVRRMYFTGDPLPARELVLAGAPLILAPSGGALDVALNFARRIARHSPTAVRVSKQVLDRIEWMDLFEGYEHEQAATCRMTGHADAQEALQASRAKREPRFEPLSRLQRFYSS